MCGIPNGDVGRTARSYEELKAQRIQEPSSNQTWLENPQTSPNSMDHVGLSIAIFEYYIYIGR